MDISGKIIKIMPLQSGEGKNGPWKKQEFVIETQAQFPKKVCFSLWGEKVDQAKLREGDTVTVSFDLESRVFNGRWYTDARAWKVSSGSVEELPPAHGISDIPPENGDAGADDLPF